MKQCPYCKIATRRIRLIVGYGWQCDQCRRWWPEAAWFAQGAITRRRTK